jgi:Fic family protein
MNVFDKIEELTETLKALQPLKPEYQQKLDKKFRLEFNYNSNHIEGNTLTYSETELLLIFDDTKGSHTLREYEEMKAHDVAYQMIKEWAKDKERPLTEQNIKNLNEVILVRPYWKEAITPDGQATRRQIKVGNYKEFPNSVRLQNGEIYEYTSPIDTPIEMQGLMEWYRVEERALHPVTLAAMLHYKFVRIHPFDDGNGRIARLLMNYVLLRNNLPPVVIKSNEKQEYIGALHLADVGDFEPFISYIAEQVVWSLELNIKAATGQSIDEPNDLDKKLELLNRQVADKLVIVEKSNEQVTRILKDVYLPLIQHTYDRVQKMAFLFQGIGLAYFKEPEELGGNIPLTATSASSIQSLTEYFLNVAQVKEDSYHRFNAGIWLVDYTKSKNKFSMEVSFKIYFDKYDYHIEARISQPYAGGFIVQQLVEIMKKFDSTVPADDFDLIKIAVGKWKYLGHVNDEFLKTKADEIANRTFDFLEQRIKKLDD